MKSPTALVAVLILIVCTGCENKSDSKQLQATPPAPVAAPQAASHPAAATAPAPAEPEYRELIIAAGTVLPLTLETAVASDTSRVEDTVRARLRRAVTIRGIEALPAGATLVGSVTDAEGSGKIKGRARVAFRFHTVRASDSSYDIRTAPIVREARGTKKKDAQKIGIGAAGGAVLGGIFGGKKGVAVGSAAGAGAGTGVVLATKGEEVRLAPGAALSTKLQEPIRVRVAMARELPAPLKP